MLPFKIHLQPGGPIFLQIANAVKKSISAGKLLPNQKLPSVRTIARELKLNPNTVQKSIALLAQQGLVETKPGMGCYVRKKPPSSLPSRLQALAPLIDHLIIEADHHGLEDAELLKLVCSRQKRIHGINR